MANCEGFWLDALVCEVVGVDPSGFFNDTPFVMVILASLLAPRVITWLLASWLPTLTVLETLLGYYLFDCWVLPPTRAPVSSGLLLWASRPTRKMFCGCSC